MWTRHAGEQFDDGQGHGDEDAAEDSEGQDPQEASEPGTLPVAGVGDVALYDEASIGGHLYVRKGSVNFAVNYAFDPLAPGIPDQHSSQIRDHLETLARAIVSRL
ncbi:hypothetical protein [Streptomyces sp. WM4235]|uniref:hypothetical protein n=1 Tax=Streptomyces sp. WM4235 TaxID=1415551 RepID=UPI00131E2963|nr:hypothetical protein [Streptomyces sp. WM4235]